MTLEPDQERLLCEMVEAAQGVDRAKQRWHLAERDQNDVLHGPWGLREVLGPDVYALHHEGFLRPAGGLMSPGSDWVLTVEAYEHCADLKARQDGSEEAPSARRDDARHSGAAPAAMPKRRVRSYIDRLAGLVKRHRAAFLVGVLSSLAATGIWALLQTGGDDQPRGGGDRPVSGDGQQQKRGTSATLDMTESVRRVYAGRRHVDGPFRRELDVEHGTVVQVGTVVQNAGENRARDVEIQWDLERKGSGIDIAAQVKATNLGPSAGYQTFASVHLASASGGHIAISTPRSFKLQHDDSKRQDKIEFDEGASIPSDRIEIETSSERYHLTIRPTPDGTLGPASQERFRVSFLLDVFEPQP